MKTCNRSILYTLLTAGTALAIGTPAALAQHGHNAPKKDPHAHGPVGHSHAAPVSAPDTYAKALAEITDRAAEVAAALDKGDLDAAHDEADVIGALAKSLGALALKKDSGVAKDQVKAINLAGKAVAARMDAIHDAADKKDLAAAKVAFAAAKTHLDTLSVAAKFTMDVKPLGGKIVVGKPATMVFTIKDPTGLPVTNVELVHEKLLHLLMVSKDLAWFAHEHPVLQADGTFTFTYTFPEAGEFVLYNDFTPLNAGQQVVQVPITVEGPPNTAPAKRALTVDADKPKTVDGYTVALDTGGPVKTGAATHMAYTVTRDGKPVTDLQPYLGAMGHLVIISGNLKEFVHSHPHESGEHAAGSHADKGKAGHAEAGAMKGGPKVDFEAHFKAAGVYKSWAQFQHQGKVITVPMTFNVAKGEAAGHVHDGKHEHK